MIKITTLNPGPVTISKKRSATSRAKRDQKRMVDKVVEVTEIFGENKGETIEFDDDNELKTPAKVRILPMKTIEAEEWIDKFYDPYWNVKLVEPHPQLNGIEKLWIYGTSYCVKE